MCWEHGSTGATRFTGYVRNGRVEEEEEEGEGGTIEGGCIGPGGRGGSHHATSHAQLYFALAGLPRSERMGEEIAEQLPQAANGRPPMEHRAFNLQMEGRLEG